MSSSPTNGAVVGSYRLLERLGKGGFSEVWRARHQSGGEEVALKLLTDPQRAELVRSEASTLKTVQGLGVVRVLEADWTHEPPYVALELVLGGDLRTRLRAAGGRLAWHEALEIVDRILESLERLHAEGVIHGDLKPENILFRGPRPLLADFALSTRVARESASLSVSRSLADATLTGTLAYLAPEVRSGTDPTRAADVFAVGIMLHELITGARPEGAFRLPAESSRDIPGFVDAVIAGALAPHPQQRFQDAGTLRRVIRTSRADAVEVIERALPIPLRCSLLAPLGALPAIPLIYLADVRQLSPHFYNGLALGFALIVALVILLNVTIHHRRRRLKSLRTVLRSHGVDC